MRLSELLVTLLNMSVTAGYVVLAVILLRLLLKKAPKWISRALWALVGLRLVLPFSIESVLSLIPSAGTVTPDILYTASPSIHSGFPALNSVVNPVLTGTMAPAAGDPVSPMLAAMQLAGILWAAGLLVMALTGLRSYLKLRRAVSPAVLLRDNVYESDAVSSPFVLGLLKPRIYLPFALSDADRRYVVAHEAAHIRRRDHWIKPLGFLLLTVYWFNPLIWVAYILLCRDIELACDEAVLRDLGAGEKKAYSTALLDCAVKRRTVAMCPLAFGEVGLKDRVKNVLSYKRPAFWIIAVAVAASIAAAVCLLTNPRISGAYPYAARLFAYRTADDGESSFPENVVSLVKLLDFPADVTRGQINMTAGLQQGTSSIVRVYFSVTPEAKAAYGASASENIGVFRENACILLALIQDAEATTFRLDDGTGDAADLRYTRDWAESVVGADLWAESASVRRLDSLLLRISQHVESAYAVAAEVSANLPDGLPTGTYTPAALVYLAPWSSMSPDGYLAQHRDRLFTIGGDSYRDADESIPTGVRYEPVEVGDTIQTFGVSGAFDIDVSDCVSRACWSVLTADGGDTGYRVFRLDGEVWIGHWSWYGAKRDAWWCEYIFKVETTPVTGGVVQGKDITLDVSVADLAPPSGTLEFCPTSNGVDAFLELLGPQRPSGYEKDECFNITPAFLEQNSPYSIFKFNQSCASYLLYDGAVTPLGEYFGGSGLDSAALADLNSDGQDELYFTFSWGSGLHRSQLGYFDPAAKEITILDVSFMSEDCMVAPDGDGGLTVSSARIDFGSGGGFVSFGITAGAVRGAVVAEGGQIRYIESES